MATESLVAALASTPKAKAFSAFTTALIPNATDFGGLVLCVLVTLVVPSPQITLLVAVSK